MTDHINHRTTTMTVSDTDCINSINGFPFSFKLAAAKPITVHPNIKPKTNIKSLIYNMYLLHVSFELLIQHIK